MALTDSLVAWYRLDGDGVDATGRGNDLTNSGASWATGKIGQAADFERGDSDYLFRADTADLSMGDIDFTIAVWCQLESDNTQMIVQKGQGFTGPDIPYQLGTVSSRFRFLVGDNAGHNGTLSATTFGAISTGVWYFVVAQHNAAANTIGISINGGAFQTTAYTFGSWDDARSLAVGSGKYHVTPGSDGYVNHWDGLIDMLGIWKRVLTTDEITQLYNAGAGLDYPFGSKGLPVIEHWHNTMYLR